MQRQEPPVSIALALIAVAGCVNTPATPSCAAAACAWPTVTASFKTTSVQELDLLFVVDDTPAVAGVVSKLVAQYPVFAQALESLPWGPPPIHVAFVPATLPSAGCSPPGNRSAICGVAAPDAFLTADNCEVYPNATQSVQDTFSCLGDFGAQSCGTAEPLEAMRRALGGDPSGHALTGRASFVSPGAELAVVFIAGQDDASARDGALVPVRDYVTFLQSLSTDPLNEIAVSLVGPEGCPAGGAVEPTPTPRLDEIVASVGSNGVALPVCDMSLANALQNLALSSGVLYKPPCLAGIKDTDPDQPGLQPDCVVEDKDRRGRRLRGDQDAADL